MTYNNWGPFYQVSRVTGPTHNVLAVELTEGLGESEPHIGTLPGFCAGHGHLDPQAIQGSVLEGLHLANRMLSTRYQVRRILYGAQDTPTEAATYGVLMLKLVTHLAWGEEFTETEAPPGVTF